MDASNFGGANLVSSFILLWDHVTDGRTGVLNFSGFRGWIKYTEQRLIESVLNRVIHLRSFCIYCFIGLLFNKVLRNISRIQNTSYQNYGGRPGLRLRENPRPSAGCCNSHAVRYFSKAWLEGLWLFFKTRVWILFTPLIISVDTRHE